MKYQVNENMQEVYNRWRIRRVFPKIFARYYKVPMELVERLEENYMEEKAKMVGEACVQFRQQLNPETFLIGHDFKITHFTLLVVLEVIISLVLSYRFIHY